MSAWHGRHGCCRRRLVGERGCNGCRDRCVEVRPSLARRKPPPGGFLHCGAEGAGAQAIDNQPNPSTGSAMTTSAGGCPSRRPAPRERARGGCSRGSGGRRRAGRGGRRRRARAARRRGRC
jgi:hypothetical protein